MRNLTREDEVPVCKFFEQFLSQWHVLLIRLDFVFFLPAGAVDNVAFAVCADCAWQSCHMKINIMIKWAEISYMILCINRIYMADWTTS